MQQRAASSAVRPSSSGGLWEHGLLTGALRLAYEFNGQIVAQRTLQPGQPDALAYVHTDHLGSVTMVTDPNRNPTRQLFSPWGEVRGGGIGQTTRNYTGQKKDGTGLLFYNARYYDPVLGRFLSADSIGVVRENPQSRNRYAYVLNNPLKFNEPTGHCYYEPRDEGERAENKACERYQDQIRELGVEIHNLYDWLSSELALLLEALQDFMRVAGWSSDDFKRAMGALRSYSATALVQMTGEQPSKMATKSSSTTGPLDRERIMPRLLWCMSSCIVGIRLQEAVCQMD